MNVRLLFSEIFNGLVNTSASSVNANRIIETFTRDVGLGIVLQNTLSPEGTTIFYVSQLVTIRGNPYAKFMKWFCINRIEFFFN